MHDMMLPIIPIVPSSVSLPVDTCQYQQETSFIQMSDGYTNSSDIYESIEIKDEKIEPVRNPSSPILKAREEEIHNRSNNLKTKIVFPTVADLTRVKRSSSTTAIERFLDYDSNSQQISSDSSTMNPNHNEILVVESKSFLDNVNFDCHHFNE